MFISLIYWALWGLSVSLICWALWGYVCHSDVERVVEYVSSAITGMIISLGSTGRISPTKKNEKRKLFASTNTLENEVTML